MSRLRGFEIANGFSIIDVRMPERATAQSAGYDFYAATDCIIEDGKIGTVATGVKSYMQKGEVLILADRSSNMKRGMFLANSIGVVDADYYNNPDNDGHIMFKFKADRLLQIKKGEKIGQGMFMFYLQADEDATTTTREGGFGSTNAK